MLHAMLLNDELHAYFLKGRVRSEVMVSEILSLIPGVGLDPHSAARDKAVRTLLGDDVADLIKGKNWNQKFVEYDKEIKDEDDDGYMPIPLGFIHYGTIDWDKGNLVCDFIPEKRERPYHLFDSLSDEMIGSEYGNNDAFAEFYDLHLDRQKIELLLPNHRIDRGDEQSVQRVPDPARSGRPRKWDWEGALTFVVSEAQTPDGLPTGPGAQARIEEMISDWFESQTGGSPSESQIRTRASSIIRMIRRPEA